MKTPILKPLTLAIMTTSLAGCFGGSSSDNDSGTLSLGITDAPVDSLEEVNIHFTGITIKPADGEQIEIDLSEPLHCLRIRKLPRATITGSVWMWIQAMSPG